MPQPSLEPLYEILAAIVHSEYPDPVHAVKETIPNEIKAVFDLFEALPIDADRKSLMREQEMYYIEYARTDIVSFHKGDWDEKIIRFS
ncbi:MAG: hypothetical protein QM802_22760 [Agriterribacter sp.]